MGIGLWLVIFRSPFMRAVTLSQRIEPQLKSQNLESRLLRSGEQNVTPFGPLERILRPLLRDGLAALGRLNPASKATARRLAQAGINKSTVDFRAEQLLWAVAGFAVSIAFIVLAAASGRFNPLLAATAVLGSAIGGFMFRDYWLGVQIKRRESRMMAEFPSLAELMALAVSAGESATGALDRVCRSAKGELTKEFTKVLAETRAGHWSRHSRSSQHGQTSRLSSGSWTASLLRLSEALPWPTCSVHRPRMSGIRPSAT